jgi:hypothetical protein
MIYSVWVGLLQPVIRSYSSKTGPKESLARMPFSRRDVTRSNSCSVSIGISARHRQHHSICMETCPAVPEWARWCGSLVAGGGNLLKMRLMQALVRAGLSDTWICLLQLGRVRLLIK